RCTCCTCSWRWWCCCCVAGRFVVTAFRRSGPPEGGHYEPGKMMNAFVHILVGLTLPPLLLGVIGKTKAFFAGRVGPPLLQPYYALIKLVQKGWLFSTPTTW